MGALFCSAFVFIDTAAATFSEGLARFLAAGGAASLALGLWGYLLVQSLFFLAGGVTVRLGSDARVDPFERARADLLALLDAP